MHLPAPVRILVTALLRLFLVLVFFGIPAGLLAVKVFGIGFGMPEKVGEALSIGPLKTEVKRLSFDLLQGLVAEEILITSTALDGRKIAEVSRTAISPSLSAMAGGKFVIDKISLDNSSAIIPLRSEDGSLKNLVLEDVTAGIVLLDNQLHLTSIRATIQGIRIQGGGTLKNPGEIRMRPGGESPNRNLETTAAKFAELLAELQYPGRQPTITFAFEGDASNPASLVVAPLTIRSGPIVGREWRFESFEADANYADGNFSLEKFELADNGGDLKLWASSRGKNLEFFLESSLGHRQFLPLVLRQFRNLPELHMEHAPWVSVEGSADFSGSAPVFRMTGAFEAPPFEVKSVAFEGAHGDFAWKDNALFVRGLEVRAEGGKLLADVLYAPGDFRAKGTTTLKPTHIAPLLDDKAKELIGHMEFRDAPWIKFSFHGNKPDFKSLDGDGMLQLGRTAMRGVWIDKGFSYLDFGDGAVTYRDFHLQHGKRGGRGNFTYDFAGQQVRLSNVVSTMDPVGVLMWVDPRIAESVRPYRFKEPPLVKGSGSIHMKDPLKNSMSLSVDSPEGLEYDLLGKTLKLGGTAATIDVVGTELRVRMKNSSLLGGRVSVDSNVSLDPKKPYFDTQVDLARVDFPKLTDLYFGFDTSKGVVSGTYQFSAPLKNPHLMKGTGSIRVEDGNVFAIPILGPLSEIINKILPGAGYETARLATCDFRIENKIITTDNLEIEGAGFSLYGNGDIHFMTDEMDMSVRINARGLPGVVLFPVSKLFEYVSTGTVSKPEWRPKIIPRIPGITEGAEPPPKAREDKPLRPSVR